MADIDLGRLEALARAAVEARRHRDSLPTFVGDATGVYVNTGPEVVEADSRSWDADRDYESAVSDPATVLALAARVRATEAERDRLRAELAETEKAFDLSQDALAAAILARGWECGISPTGHCEYGDDPGNEYCVHCNQPSERK